MFERNEIKFSVAGFKISFNDEVAVFGKILGGKVFSVFTQSLPTVWMRKLLH